ncbi:uncharacterized protein LOC143185133 [Calliopsis andreniformis]|uniref:uncharacterized protein LOC143185133 n=1 Tax=Calliopsis andreniformis TaxID=337506 RepID=UPI003FCD7F1E
MLERAIAKLYCYGLCHKPLFIAGKSFRRLSPITTWRLENLTQEQAKKMGVGKKETKKSTMDIADVRKESINHKRLRNPALILQTINLYNRSPVRLHVVPMKKRTREMNTYLRFTRTASLKNGPVSPHGPRRILDRPQRFLTPKMFYNAESCKRRIFEYFFIPSFADRLAQCATERTIIGAAYPFPQQRTGFATSLIRFPRNSSSEAARTGLLFSHDQVNSRRNFRRYTQRKQKQ